MKTARILLAAALALLVAISATAQATKPYVVLKNGRRVEGTAIKSISGIISITLANGQVQQFKPGEYVEAGGGPKPQSLLQADAALKGGKFDEAARLYQQAEKEARGLDHGTSASIGYADALLGKGDAAGAVAAYNKLIGGNAELKKNPAVAWGRRKAMLANKEFGPLGRDLDAVAANGTRADAAKAQNMRGDIAIAQNDVPNAVLEYLRTALLFTDCNDQQILGEACYKAAEALASMRDARAKDLYRKAANDYPASTYAAQAKAKM
ncbi:MAG: tetratricopeptide repeat protein [Kiritimatiellae bacterium]|nr:tetratricopeptide repeat protein [Kiritimatiellia bacterium]